VEFARVKLVFVHGAGCTSTAFSAQLEAFADAVALTLPGHQGDGGQPASIEELADAVSAKLDRLGTGNVLLCGHSMGGAIALEVGLRGDARVRGVIAIGTGARMRVAPALLKAMEDDFPAAVRSFAGAFFARPDPALVDAAVATMLAVGREQTLRDLRACDAFDAVDRLGGLRVPLLAITGASDALTPPKYAHFLASRVPEGSARIVEQTGHFVMIEEPGETNAAIRAFADRIAHP
jgi:pimeloyl-ACP methyl ester carboxylesterase